MTTSAIIMMILAILMFWGGLAWSLVRLRNRPELPED